MSTPSKRTWLLATAVSAPNLSTFQRCAAVTRAGEQQFCLDGHIWPKKQKTNEKTTTEKQTCSEETVPVKSQWSQSE